VHSVFQLFAKNDFQKQTNIEKLCVFAGEIISENVHLGVRLILNIETICIFRWRSVFYDMYRMDRWSFRCSLFTKVCAKTIFHFRSQRPCISSNLLPSYWCP